MNRRYRRHWDIMVLGWRRSPWICSRQSYTTCVDPSPLGETLTESVFSSRRFLGFKTRPQLKEVVGGSSSPASPSPMAATSRPTNKHDRKTTTYSSRSRGRNKCQNLLPYTYPPFKVFGPDYIRSQAAVYPSPEDHYQATS